MWPARAATDTDGFFELLVPPGTHSLSIYYSAYSEVDSTDYRFDFGTLEITENTDLGDLVINLATIEVTVQGPDGNPIFDATVAVGTEDMGLNVYGYADGTTNTAGTFIATLPPGNGFVTVTPPPDSGRRSFSVSGLTITGDQQLAILMQFLTETSGEPVVAGGTVTTDTEDGGDGATPSDPIETSVTSPNEGFVTIAESPITVTSPEGWDFLTQQINISAPDATPADPLQLVFTIDASRIPEGEDETTVHLFKAGVLVEECIPSDGSADPDPCISQRSQLADDDVQLTVLTSTASPWNFGISTGPPPNVAPVAADDAYTTDEDVPLIVGAPGVLDNDTDADGDPIGAGLDSETAHGTLTLESDGSFVYTPEPDFHGSDTFTYHASDTTDGSNVATVTIIVVPVNDPPEARDDEYTLLAGPSLMIDAPGVLGNDTDVEGGSLTVSSYTQPVDGTVAMSNDGSFTYTPRSQFCGSDSFEYAALDEAGAWDTATVTVWSCELGLDIKPRSFPNSINWDDTGIIPVAILGGPSVDVHLIDPLSLDFDGLSVRIVGKDRPQCSVKDISGDFSLSELGAPDGYLDLVCKFSKDSSNPAPSSWGLVIGTYDGTPFWSIDSLRIVPGGA